MTSELNPMVPRPIDLPTQVQLGPTAELAGLDGGKILAAPDDPGQWPAWRESLARWKAEARARIGYSDALYREPGLEWGSRCYSACLAWLWDETLYDHRSNRFTAEAFVAAGRRDFGGFDAVVLWQAYPVIGIDDRNQFDFYRDVSSLPELVAEFHRLGVRIFLDYNPWDIGTRRETVDDGAALAELIAWSGADGLFLDTLREGAAELREALGPVALEGESSVPLARIADHGLSWAQWCADSPVPGVLRAHWFERRHMMHQTRRWNRDHAEELQTAWLNGCGMLVWEAVFGSWVGWNRRDRSNLRAMLAVQRRFSRHLIEGEWTPLGGGTAGPVHSSRWDLEGQTLWTLVNRGDTTHTGLLLTDVARPGHRWFDLWSGRELEPIPAGDHVELLGEIPGRGLAGVLAIPSAEAGPALISFLAERAVATPDAGAEFPGRVSRRVPPPEAAAGSVPAEMVGVAGGERTLTVRYQVRETGLYGDAPFVEEWKPLPPRLHAAADLQLSLSVDAYAISRSEVTNSEFADFLAATGYTPACPQRFLRHWQDGRPPSGRELAPVTFVELADARAYAGWRGWRLPTEHEWQVASEVGLLERLAPRVWNWTESEHGDGRTRWAILKGGADFQAEGSEWYVPGGHREPSFSLKLLLCGEGLARSSEIGFRCAVTLT